MLYSTQTGFSKRKQPPHGKISGDVSEDNWNRKHEINKSPHPRATSVFFPGGVWLEVDQKAVAQQRTVRWLLGKASVAGAPPRRYLAARVTLLSLFP